MPSGSVVSICASRSRTRSTTCCALAPRRPITRPCDGFACRPAASPCHSGSARRCAPRRRRRRAPGCSPRVGDHDVRDVLERAHVAVGAQQPGFLVLAAAGPRRRCGCCASSASCSSPSVRPRAASASDVRHDLEAAHEAAERVDIGHAGQAAQLRSDRPVEHRALFLERLRPLEREHVHVRQRRADRREAAAGGGRQAVGSTPASRSLTCCRAQ